VVANALLDYLFAFGVSDYVGYLNSYSLEFYQNVVLIMMVVF